jgi:AcrR family transcriptional regulator
MVEETRAKLMQAARKAFAEKGYAAASMDDLTAEAGLTRGALYHNFGDKRGLLQAVVDQIDAEMAARARAVASKAGNAWEGLLAEGAAYIEMALEPEVQRIVLLDDNANGPGAHRAGIRQAGGRRSRCSAPERGRVERRAVDRSQRRSASCPRQGRRGVPLPGCGSVGAPGLTAAR